MRGGMFIFHDEGSHRGRVSLCGGSHGLNARGGCGLSNKSLVKQKAMNLVGGDRVERNFSMDRDKSKEHFYQWIEREHRGVNLLMVCMFFIIAPVYLQ